METKKGRGRVYSVSVPQGFASREVAFAAAYMDELRERVFDQIVDLPQDALDFVSGETRLSIGRLGLHLAWAEAGWVSRLSGGAPPEEIKNQVDPGALGLFGEAPPETGGASEIIAICRQVRDEVTLPYLRGVDDFDQTRLDDGSTIRGVIMHLQWHWVFCMAHFRTQ